MLYGKIALVFLLAFACFIVCIIILSAAGKIDKNEVIFYK